MVAQGHGVARFSGCYPNQRNCRDSGRAEARALAPSRNGRATGGTGAPLANRADLILTQRPLPANPASRVRAKDALAGRSGSMQKG
jgi:hypothetical protein